MSIIDYGQLDKELGIDNSLPEFRNMLNENIQKITTNISDPTLIESIVQQALQTLNASQNANDELSKRNAFKKFIGIFSGGNNRLRDFSNQHLRESQRATFHLVEELSKNQSVMSDAIMISQNAIKHLQYENLKIKELLINIIDRVQARFIGIEEELLLHRYKINFLVLRNDIKDFHDSNKIPGLIKYKQNSLCRLFDLTNQYFDLVEGSLKKFASEDDKNLYRWSSRIIQRYVILLSEFSGFVNGENNLSEFTLEGIVKMIHSELPELMTNSLLENLIFDYPIAYMTGASISARIMFLTYLGFQQKKSVREIIDSIVKELPIPKDFKINILDFGCEILYQMKLNSSEQYLQNTLQDLLKEIAQENLDPINKNQNGLFKNESLTHLDDGKYDDIFAGRYYEVIRGKYAINFHLQFSNFDKNPYLRLIFEFINSYSLFSEKKINRYANEEKLFLKDYKRDGTPVHELIYEVPAQWSDWSSQKKALIVKIENTFNFINES